MFKLATLFCVSTLISHAVGLVKPIADDDGSLSRRGAVVNLRRQITVANLTNGQVDPDPTLDGLEVDPDPSQSDNAI